MNNVCVILRNGNKLMCSYFPESLYLKLEEQNKIKRVRKLTAFDRFVVNFKIRIEEITGRRT